VEKELLQMAARFAVQPTRSPRCLEWINQRFRVYTKLLTDSHRITQ
jgi:hypothetical protein